MNRINCAIIVFAATWAGIRWPQALSLFGFESPYWDLGLFPILVGLLLGANHIKVEGGRRRRFLIGFMSCGLVAAIAYTISCSRPARWSLVSVLQPFQTGFMLAPEMKTSWTDLKPWGVFVDTVIVVSLPLLPALLVGVIASARITLARVMIAIALIALVFGGVGSTIRTARQYDRMGLYHRNQIIGVVWGRLAPDGKRVYEPSTVDRNGKSVSPRQQRIDRWHEAMAQKYWHSAFYPWSAPVEELLPPE
jgi:hypothetical protein